MLETLVPKDTPGLHRSSETALLVSEVSITQNLFLLLRKSLLLHAQMVWQRQDFQNPFPLYSKPRFSIGHSITFRRLFIKLSQMR